MATAKKAPAKKASAKKAPAKKAPAKKASAKKQPAKKTAATKAPANQASGSKAAPAKRAVTSAAATKARPAKDGGAKAGAAKAPGKKSSRSSGKDYTKPELRERIKGEVLAGDKGGRAGQWSARKAQMVAHEYEAEGGGYKHPRNATQQSLKAWGDEKWHTADGKAAVQGEETHRYLPDAAWKELSPEEKKATDRKKVAGSRRGRQFVANTPEAAEARRHATQDEG